MIRLVRSNISIAARRCAGARGKKQRQTLNVAAAAAASRASWATVQHGGGVRFPPDVQLAAVLHVSARPRTLPRARARCAWGAPCWLTSARRGFFVQPADARGELAEAVRLVEPADPRLLQGQADLRAERQRRVHERALHQRRHRARAASRVDRQSAGPTRARGCEAAHATTSRVVPAWC